VLLQFDTNYYRFVTTQLHINDVIILCRQILADSLITNGELIMKFPKLTCALALTTALVAPALVVPSISLAADTATAATQTASEKGAKIDHHLAKLKENLKITASQEAAWGAYSSSVKKQMLAFKEHRHMMREQGKSLTAVERMDDQVKFHEQQLANLKDTQSALKTLYGQLTPAQQKVFNDSVKFHHKKK